MAEDQKNKPSYCCHAYHAMKPAWRIMADTTAGTLRLRNVDTLLNAYYLPAEPAEKTDHYTYRKARAIFFNATQRTLHGLVGMVFRKEPKLGEDVPEVIRGVEAVPAKDGKEATPKKEGEWENIDLAGTHGSVFLKEVFTNAMRDGHAAVLVDMPPALPEGSTAADENGRRPYWVSYRADQIVNWRTGVVDGKTVLTLIVFKEISQEPDGDYGEKSVTRYRVLRRAEDGTIQWELYKEQQAPSGQVEPVFEAGGPISLSEIPVAFAYSRKCGTAISQPPLLDLAMINIAHYQKYSDFSIYLHISSRPLLWFRNRNTNSTVEDKGPYTFFDVGENGEVAYAETTGASLEAASNDIKDLETRMAALGLSIVEGKSKPQPESTATEEVLDHVREESELATSARSLKDLGESCLKWHVQYKQKAAKTGGSLELGATIEEMTLPPQELQAYSNMVAAKQMSLETLWAILGRSGKLPADFDADEEKTKIEADVEVMMDRMLQEFEAGGGVPPMKRKAAAEK